MKRQSGSSMQRDPYAAFIRGQASPPRSGGVFRRRPSRLGRSSRRCASRARAFVRPDARSPLSTRARVLGTLVRRLRDRTTDFSEQAGRPGHRQPLPPGPVETLPRRPVGSWPLGLGSDGPARPAAVYRPGEARLCGALRGCVRGRRTGDRARTGNVPRRIVGASLLPVGTPLLGLQVYDNRRAVDYLISRPEVDASQLAITGASGGGNQTLYAGATDDRLKAVIPVCGIGTYDAYLSTACCVCEVNAGGAVTPRPATCWP